MSNRIEKINSLVQKEMGQILLREIEFPAGALVTITNVKTSVDLANARVYISVIPQEKSERVLEILGKMIYPLQQFLNKRMRTRPIPKIRFVPEELTARAAKIEGLLRKIKE